MASRNFPVIQEREGEWTSPRSFLIKEVQIPHFFAPDPAVLHDYIVNFQTRADDVFVVSYPKSGTTWMREILWQLYNNGENSTTAIYERVVLLERGTCADRPDAATYPSPRLMSTHLIYDVIPKGDCAETRCKYIYIARNPKDVAVSFYEFMKGYAPIIGYNGPWEFFAKLFLEGKVPFGLWSDHVLGWWKHKDEPNVLFLKYEDLKKDLSSSVRLIAEFLNRPVTEDTINKIAEQCSFQGMKENESRYLPEGREAGPTFLRKGKIGDWKNYFTPDLNKKFENEVLDKLRGTGLQFDFGN